MSADYILFGKIDAPLADSIAEAINKMTPLKRHYAQSIIQKLIKALSVDE